MISLKDKFNRISTDCNCKIVSYIAEAHKIEAACHKKEKCHHKPVRTVKQPFDKEEAGQKCHGSKYNPIIIISKQALQYDYQRLKADFKRYLRIPADNMQKLISVSPIVIADANPQSRKRKQNRKDSSQKYQVQHFLPVPRDPSSRNIRFSCVDAVHKISHQNRKRRYQ